MYGLRNSLRGKHHLILSSSMIDSMMRREGVSAKVSYKSRMRIDWILNATVPTQYVVWWASLC